MTTDQAELSTGDCEFVWLQGCRIVFGHTRDQDLISAARMLIKSGFVLDDLRDILSYPNVAIAPRFEAALAELGLLPTREQALRCIVIRVLHRMVKDRASLRVISQLILAHPECREVFPELNPVCEALDRDLSRLPKRQMKKIWDDLDTLLLMYSKASERLPML